MRNLLALVALSVIACGGTPPSPAAPAPEPPPAPSKPLVLERQASSDLKHYWAFGNEPTFGLYMDVDSLLHTELFEAVVPAMLNLSADSLRGKQRNCVDALL